MKIAVHSNVMRKLIAEKLSNGTSDPWTLSYDVRHDETVFVRSEDPEEDSVFPLLYLEDLKLPWRGFDGEICDAYQWLSRKHVWAEIALTMEDNAALEDHWLQWQDAEHFLIGADALARQPYPSPPA